MNGPAGALGLTAAEAAERLREHGPNLPPRARPRRLLGRILDQLRDPMILLLLGAFVVIVALGDVADASIIAAVVVLNTTIGVVQEVRAANALAALDRMAAPWATVLRDGELSRIPAPDVVTGDLIRLEAGDVVPADGELVEAAGLQVDESAMTGESVPVIRGPGEELLAGTVLTRGRGFATVSRTGGDSGLGRIAAQIAAAGVRPTPLQQRLSKLSRQLVVLTLAIAALVLLLGVLRGEPLDDMVILAVSLAVAAIPESLPAVVTIALALGAYRMARRSALVRRLPAVETLGSVTVLASDKTGTLTEGRMVVQELWSPHGTWRVTGQGYAVDGALVAQGPDVVPAELDALARDLVLCNDARLGGPRDGSWEVVGDPMEAALLVAVAKHDPAALDAAARWERVDETPFDSETKRMTTVHRSVDGERPWLVVCKGAPEAVIGLLADRAVAAAAHEAATALAERGFRVLAVADRRAPERPDGTDHGLVLRGLAALADPPRTTAEEVVRACREAGIRTVMITGDHPATARAIADQLTLTREGPELAEGAEIGRGEHAGRVDRIGVYARVRPEHKVDIVDAWQRRGDVVAMTGDGVNDAPALRRADIGIAMGDRGTEVARQAADLVLADDDLRTVVVAVGEGRRIYGNIRRFLRYGLSGGFAEVLVLMAGPFVGIPIPLGPGQILWINMITHGLPGVAFGGEPPDPADMKRPSPSPEQSVLGRGLLRQILVAGTLIGIVALAAGLLAPDSHRQTWVFLTLGLAQLGVALSLRAPRGGLQWRSRGLEVAVLIAAALQVLAVAWSPLRDLLRTDTVPAADALLVLALSAAPGLVLGLWQRFSARWGSASDR
ncbi:MULTISPECIES: cation-transporting P-type ATPase [unclassified Nocardioides]|uniref:cation-translocating P-type ATPase n=1 Tax=unclassified Nocardioides TaxID=2615069 RepID=UPI000056FDA7|nr:MULTISPECIES: cation-transporting P-type ATPase [unclassified Nocardioides]ABL80519.1 ATPase, P-type (transporting), HAD superfamily, subfamily IC [Nocardioides sp. JS614]